MTEKKENVQRDKNIDPKEREKLESVRKADAAVKTMQDFTSPEVLYQELITSVRKYHPSTDITMIQKAYEVASDAHKDQKRKSGEPYIIHPLCVAIILADLELDKETIVAGLLHDAVEDTWMTTEEVEKEFSAEVALLVDGVTKLGQLSYSADKVELQAENLRKMFLAMAKDIRVILIKLADRLHNMRTLQYMRPEKQQEKARETMDIYAPIAMRLGISKIKVELDDLSLKYLKPDVYYDLVNKVALRKSERQEFVNNIVKQVKQHMDEAAIKAQVDGRIKHFFSIYKKMVNQDKTIDQIYDLFAVRILVDTVKDCYAALGVIHEMYKPIPGRFKDYIAMPKPNMYQSLHTTLIGPNGQPFEIQIRTFEMHKTAEYGIAAHWKYKESSDGKVPVDKRPQQIKQHGKRKNNGKPQRQIDVCEKLSRQIIVDDFNVEIAGRKRLKSGNAARNVGKQTIKGKIAVARRHYDVVEKPRHKIEEAGHKNGKHSSHLEQHLTQVVKMSPKTFVSLRHRRACYFFLSVLLSTGLSISSFTSFIPSLKERIPFPMPRISSGILRPPNKRRTTNAMIIISPLPIPIRPNNTSLIFLIFSDSKIVQIK